MKYFISEIQTDENQKKTAGIKARDDAEEIMKDNGFIKIQLPVLSDNRKEGNIASKIKKHYEIYKIWKQKLKVLNNNDTLVIQFPAIEHTLFLSRVIKKLKAKNIKVILLIHDLELLRVSLRSNTSFKKKVRLNIEEKTVLEECDKIIAHNQNMIDFIGNLGINKDKIVDLEIFDYIIQDYDRKDYSEDYNSVIIAGNLQKMKAEYAYQLPEDLHVNLYGINFEGKTNENIIYHGSFLPNEVPYKIDGGFGLVWDGNSTKTCSGVYGEYLKINNPHKTSLYLASGFPIIIWKQAALAKFVENKKCGITVESLFDINNVISQLTQEEYNVLKKNALIEGKKLRDGFYLKKALELC
jgi:hypothetical protein